MCVFFEWRGPAIVHFWRLQRWGFWCKKIWSGFFRLWAVPFRLASTLLFWACQARNERTKEEKGYPIHLESDEFCTDRFLRNPFSSISER